MARGKRHLSGESSDSQYIPLPPDGGYGWIIVAASFANHVIVDGITFTFGIFYSEFSDYFGGSSKGQISLVGALLAGCYLLTAPFAGSMVNKFGCRAVSIAGAIIASIGFLASTVAPSVHLLTLTYGVIGGFGLGLLYLPNIIAVSYYFERHRSIATGIAVCGAGVGCFVMAPVGRLLLDVYDWKNAMFIVTGITLNGCVFGALLRPLTQAPPMMTSLKITLHDRVTSDVAVNSGSSADLEAASTARKDSAILIEESPADGAATPVDDRVPAGVAMAAAGQIWSGRRRSCSDAPVYSKTRMRAADRRRQESENMRFNGITKRDACHSSTDVMTSDAEPRTPDVAAIGQGGTRLFRSEACVATFAAERRHSQRRALYSRPLYRKDIFFSGSTLRLPEFNQLSDVRSYLRQMTVDPDDDHSSSDERPTSPCCSTPCFPRLSRAVRFAWHEMTNLRLLNDRIFLIPCLGNMFATIGLFVPFVYCANRAMSLGVDSHLAAFLISIIGITNTIGRIIAGVIASVKWVNALLLHNVALVGAGLVCIAQATFGVNYAAMATLAALFGLCIATWISLTSVVLCDLLGVERLTNAFGLLTMTRGLAAMIGSPMAGCVFDATGNYDASFYVGGAMMTVGGALCCLLHLSCFRSTPIGGSGASDELQKKSESGFEELEFEGHLESAGQGQCQGHRTDRWSSERISSQN
jgi:MFS family permease